MKSMRSHLNLDQVESFVALAERGGVGAAARWLGRAQPTVSQQLQKLEKQLQRPLFDRGASGLRLTPEGLQLLPLARGLLRLDRQCHSDMPSLRLGACSNIGVYLLPQLLSGYHATGAALPGIEIATNPVIADRLINGEIDLALLEWWEPQADFEYCDWRHEPVVAILPPGHPLAIHDAIDLGALQRHPVLGGEEGTGTGRLLRKMGDAPASIVPTLTLGSTEAVKRAVAAGLGVSVVLQLAVVAETDRQLIVRPLQPLLHKPLKLVWRDGLSPQSPLLHYLQQHSRPN